MRFKAVLFDMFDTLMMIQKGHMFYQPALHKAYEHLTKNGVTATFPQFRTAYIKERDALYVKADQTMQEPHFNVRIANTLRNLGYPVDENSEIVVGATRTFCDEFIKYVAIDPDAKDMLMQLYGKVKLGVVSNFAIPECVLKLLSMHGLDSVFDVIIVSAAVNIRKPNIEIFKHALMALNVAASDAAFVGDTVDADVVGAKKAGMKTIYIERRLQKEAEAACPDQTIKSLIELPNALERC